MKKELMSLIAAFCLSCSGQQVITNYIYEVREYTNNIWTVSNVTIVTRNEITQNVNRVYNYYSTNFTINVETNLYIDTLIGTNVTINIETNTYNIYTNIYAQTNLTVDITTNYTTYITLTNFEGWAARCETSESNSLLYAYIANDAALRLGSTNAVVFSTNSYYYVDIIGRTYSNILCLACNNMNGVVCASNPPSAVGSSRYASRSYRLSYPGSSSSQHIMISGEVLSSHCIQTDVGMKILYFPTNMSYSHINQTSTATTYYAPTYIEWHTNRLTVHISSFIKSGDSYSHRNDYVGYVDDSEWPANLSYTSLKRTPTSNLTINSKEIQISTSSPSSSIKNIFFPSFPTIDGWKYMWWLSNTTGTNVR